MLDYGWMYGAATDVRGAPEIVTVMVGSDRYTSWKRVLISASIREAARSFHLEVAAETGAPATARQFKAGAEVDISANNDRLLIGYVDRYQPRIEAGSAGITITGRSKAADLIDSSAVHKTGRFKQKTLVEFGNELAQPHGVKIITDQTLAPFDHQITPGTTVFREIEKKARSEGLTLMGDADGNVVVTKAGTKRHAGGIFEGKNLKIGEADHNWSNRFGKYIVRAQRTTGHGADSLEIEALARDAKVRGNRVLVVVQDDDSDHRRAKKRAKGRRDRSAGAALCVNVTLPGFRDEAGVPWTPGWLVWTESPYLDVAQDMLIEDVTYGQDEQGSLTQLKLVDPRAYDGKKSKGNKSGDDWDMDDSEAEG
ncbi:phage baseplate assembly protein [Microvirga solisilvae]|uniref:phage baseplate assembly protein n=1 Tax=Microvirga solisilvae TaxID=2919498 RepID=UPI001FAF482A|nr:hypothetical protein [Microvirga solisilvae]